MRIRAGLLAIVLFGCSTQQPDPGDPGGAPTQTDNRSSGLELGKPIWVPLASETPAEPEVAIVGDEIVMRLAGYYTASAMVNGEHYVRISVPGHSALSKAGMPELPKVRLNVPLAPSVE